MTILYALLILLVAVLVTTITSLDDFTIVIHVNILFGNLRETVNMAKFTSSLKGLFIKKLNLGTINNLQFGEGTTI